MPTSPTMLAIAERQSRLERITHHASIQSLRPRSLRRQVRAFYPVLDLQAPHLLDQPHPSLFIALARLAPSWCRPLWRWTGQGGLEGLIAHLLVEKSYPLPEFLLGVPSSASQDLEEAQQELLTSLQLVQHLGAGGSLRQAARQGLIPACLTRRMHHALLTLKDHLPLIHAIRRVQIQIFEGPTWLARKLLETPLGARLEDEACWQRIIAWLCAGHGELPRDQLPFLVDHLRSLPRCERLALTKLGVRTVLNQAQAHRWASLCQRLGAQPGSLPWAGVEDDQLEKVWTVTQIRTTRELIAEGQLLQHCIANYYRQIMADRWAVFSVKEDGERRLTVLVSRSRAQVVEARGLRNRRPSRMEGELIARWATRQGLQLP